MKTIKELNKMRVLTAEDRYMLMGRIQQAEDVLGLLEEGDSAYIDREELKKRIKG